MIEQGYIYIILSVAVILLFVIFGIRCTLKQYRDASDGEISGLKDALKFEKEMGRQAEELSNMTEALCYIEFKELQKTDVDKIAVFFRNIRYILGIACVYIVEITLLCAVCIACIPFVRSFAWNIGEDTYFLIAGTGLIALGIGTLCVVEYPKRYFPRCLFHPLIRCIPKSWKRVSTLDKVGVVIRSASFIMLGIGGIVAQYIVK